MRQQSSIPNTQWAYGGQTSGPRGVDTLKLTTEVGSEREGCEGLWAQQCVNAALSGVNIAVIIHA